MIHSDMKLVKNHDKHIDEIKIAIKKNEFTKALEMLQGENKKIRPHLWYIESFCYSKLNQKSNALSSLKKFMKHTKPSLGHYEKIAQIYQLLDEPKKSITYLKKIIQKYGKNEEALHGLAHSYEKIGNYELALDFYKQTAKISKDSGILTHIGDMYEKLGDYHKSFQARKEAYKLNPSRFLKSNLAVAYSEIEDFRSSSKLFRQILKQEPKELKVRYNYALSLHRDKKELESLRELKKVIYENPTYVEALSLKSRINFNLGDFNEALLIQYQLEEMKSVQRRDELLQCAILDKLHRNKELIDLINKLSKKYPKDFEIMLNKLFYFSKLNKNQIALNITKKILKKYPKNVKYLLMKLHLEYTLKKKNIKKLCQKILTIDKKNRIALLMLSEIFLKEGNSKLALQFANKAEKINPESPIQIEMYSEYFLKSLIFLDVNKFKKALYYIDKALLIEPLNKDILFFKGFILKKMNTPEKANTVFDFLKKMDKKYYSKIPKTDELKRVLYLLNIQIL